MLTFSFLRRMAITLLLSAFCISTVQAQERSDFDTLFGGGETEVSNETLLAALEEAAESGQPIALWRLGEMYENGEGVRQDRAKAFRYFRALADGHADTPPRAVDADIVARGFLKVGEYYREGLPDVGVEADSNMSRKLWLHAASYFRDADAQYRIGRLYLDENEFGYSPRQSVRWLALASRKGHPAAQATLGGLLFDGEGIDPNPVEGLLWLTLASRNARGTEDENWIQELHDRILSDVSPEQYQEAVNLADRVEAGLRR